MGKARRFNIGDKIGLYQIKDFSKVDKTYGYICICLGCGENKFVSTANLTLGKNKGCYSCRVVKHHINKGDVFGKWKVVDNSQKRKVICKCSCGEIGTVTAVDLVRGNTKQCMLCKYGHDKDYIPLPRNTKLYLVWVSMKQRCSNPNSESYKNYGGRGITVCDEWVKSYYKFHNWAKDNGYKEGLTIERVNNNEGYSPENCVFADKHTQANNTRSNIVYKGETAAQASRRLGGKSSMVAQRIRKGIPIQTAFTFRRGLLLNNK